MDIENDKSLNLTVFISFTISSARKLKTSILDPAGASIWRWFDTVDKGQVIWERYACGYMTGCLYLYVMSEQIGFVFILALSVGSWSWIVLGTLAGIMALSGVYHSLVNSGESYSEKIIAEYKQNIQESAFEEPVEPSSVMRSAEGGYIATLVADGDGLSKDALKYRLIVEYSPIPTVDENERWFLDHDVVHSIEFDKDKCDKIKANLAALPPGFRGQQQNAHCDRVGFNVYEEIPVLVRYSQAYSEGLAEYYKQQKADRWERMRNYVDSRAEKEEFAPLVNIEDASALAEVFPEDDTDNIVSAEISVSDSAMLIDFAVEE